MIKRFFSIFVAVLILALTISSCKQSGSSFISVRNITDNTLVNAYGGYLQAKAYPDSVIYAGIHYAEVMGEPYEISDTLFIRYFGHCWSLDNKDPLITNSRHTIFDINTDTVEISPEANEFKYISKLYGLLMDTVYYVRSYVIFTDANGNIVDTGYNPNVKEFRTRIPQDVWFRRADFDGEARTEAVAYIYDGKIYVGLGYNGFAYLNDFWEYNPDAKTWRNVKGFPKARMSAVAAVYNDTVVVGTGLSQDGPERDMWRYDKFSNLWQPMDSLPGNCERYDAVAFTLNLNGKQRVIIGTGFRNSPLNDFYYYKSEADTAGAIYSAWRPLTSSGFPGAARSQAVAAVIGNRAIVGLGKSANGYLRDFYILNPDQGYTLNWTYLTELPPELSSGRANAVAFGLSFERNGSLNNWFFFGTGRDENDSLYNDLWAYDINQGKWMRKSDIREDFIIGEPREGAVGLSFTRSHVEFGTLVRGLVGLGKNKDGKTLKDFWEYLP